MLYPACTIAMAPSVLARNTHIHQEVWPLLRRFQLQMVAIKPQLCSVESFDAPMSHGKQRTFLEEQTVTAHWTTTNAGGIAVFPHGECSFACTYLRNLHRMCITLFCPLYRRGKYFTFNGAADYYYCFAQDEIKIVQRIACRGWMEQGCTETMPLFCIQLPVGTICLFLFFFSFLTQLRSSYQSEWNRIKRSRDENIDGVFPLDFPINGRKNGWKTEER